ATIESHSTSARSMGQGWPWRDKCDDPSLLHFAAQEGNLRVLDIILSLGSDKVEQQAKSDLDDGLKPIDEKIFVAMALQSGSAQILEVLSRALGEANGVDPPRILDWKSKGLVLKDNLNPCEWLDESLGTPTNSMVTMYEPTYLFWLCFGRPGECGQYGHRFGRKHGGQYEPIDVLEFPDHHVFDRVDWQQISKVAHGADLIVCTEKDLVKLRRFPFARGRLAALRLELRLDPADEESLLRVVAEKGGLVAERSTPGV
ncbi:MAG: tetraacyldisaccharide 4'-kinase, partial [bacterium]